MTGNTAGGAVRTDSEQLWNDDLAPTSQERRTWTWYHYLALWIGLVMSIPAYLLASSMIDGGMSWDEAIFTVFLGNVIVLVPMLLIGHAGAKYGIPYPVLARAAFGTIGARLPAMMRAIVACGWYGIQTWFGGHMVYTLLGVLSGAPIGGEPLPFLGINLAELLCFVGFWAIQMYFVIHGIESIRKLETYTAPLKILVCFALLWWAIDKAGGLGPLFDRPSEFAPGQPKEGQFWSIFWPSLTAMVGYWATLALNIPDFTRYARSQRDQMVGQTLGLPLPMGGLAALAVIVTSATIVAFGESIWDPVTVAGKMTGAAVLLSLIVLLIDTISVNLAANLVGPAFDFSALNPKRISYRMGGLITAGIGLVMMPWKILESTHGYIFTWLIGYSALLGPIAGILLADYWFLRRTRLNVPQLYENKGQYSYSNGWNRAALIAFILGALPNLPGFLHAAFPETFSAELIPAFFISLYTYAWFAGAALGFVIYLLLMKLRGQD